MVGPRALSQPTRTEATSDLYSKNKKSMLVLDIDVIILLLVGSGIHFEEESSIFSSQVSRNSVTTSRAKSS